MAISFEVRHTEGLSRLGTLTTPHGTVETPLLMPVVNPNRPTVPAAAMARDHGVEMVITNSYIIRSKPAMAERARADGVHALIGFDGPVMTDSGTFQSYVYGDVAVAPDEIVAFQRDIGVDIATILDVFSTPERTLDEASDDVHETLKRAMDTLAVAGDTGLALTVQGATFPALREEAARDMARLTPAGEAIHPIGGVVPLMEQQRYATLARIVLGAKRGLHAGRAVHLFGAGHPHMLALAVYLGCDLFDSAAYAKFAQNDRLLFPWGTEQLDHLDELPCACPVCQAWTPDELRGADQSEREAALAGHNLHVTMAELRRVREAQRRGRLYDLVLERAVGHPALLEALDVVVEHVAEIEREEPASHRRALAVVPDWHQGKGHVHRALERVPDRVRPIGPLVLLDETPRPFTANARALVEQLVAAGFQPCFPSRLGPVPFQVDEAFPFSQSLEPRLDDDERADQLVRLDAWARAAGTDVVTLAEALTRAGTHAGAGAEDLEEADVEPVDADDLREVVPLDGPARTAPVPRQERAETVEDADAAEPSPRLPVEPGPGQAISHDPVRLHQVRATAAYQFGPQAARALLEGDVALEVSPRTERVRRVFVDGQHVASVRARDGLFTLKLAGARRVHEAVPRPWMRLRVTEDSAPFNAEGKSVFAKFVLACDKALRPGDECLVVDPDDQLVAVGQLLVSAREALALTSGPAAKVREGVKGGGAGDDEP